MKRWNTTNRKNETNKKIDDYLNEIIEISKKHGFSISHQDRHGSFEIRKYDQSLTEWLLGANDTSGE